MQNTKSLFQKNQMLTASKDIVSRKNQDGTVILMKLDDNNIFYKIDGLLAQIWIQFQSPLSFEILNQALESISGKNGDLDLITQKIELFIQELGQRQLLIAAKDPAPEDIYVRLANLFAPMQLTDSNLGGIKDFNLDQIESEVLNDSVYLDVFAGSDIALKTNVSPIDGALKKLTYLEGVHFNWLKDLEAEASLQPKLQTGVLAQQVAEVMPELVRRDVETGHLAVNYSKIIPYLIEGMKELNLKSELQQKEISELKKTLENLHRA